MATARTVAAGTNPSIRYTETPATNSPTNIVTSTGPSSASVTGTGTQTTNTNATENSDSTTNTQNMDAKSIAMLQTLIKQLIAGGTEQQQMQQAQRQGEVQYVQGQRDQYTKQAAFADAEGAMAAQLRQALLKLIPGINNAASGAGTSQSSMRALLMEQAAKDAADSAATLGLKASVDYGNVGANLSNILQSLTAPNNDVMNSLLNAFNTLKGASVSSTTTGTKQTNTTGTTNTSTNQNTNTSGSTENKNIAYNGQQIGSSSDGLISAGPMNIPGVSQAVSDAINSGQINPRDYLGALVPNYTERFQF